MRNLILGFVLAVVVGLVCVWGYDYYYARRNANAAATYLFSTTEVKGKDGKPLSRADLIDALLSEAIQRHATKAQPAK
jgi:hypothetical protein